MAAPKTRSGFWLPALSLSWRELVRFFRQRGRVIGALLTPLLFWLLLGSGFGRSFQAGGAGYLEYAYPGTMIMIILFTSIFASISTIEDRREGFLQSVLIAPVPRASIVAGKVLGAALVAVIQSVLFLGLAPAIGLGLGVGQVLAAAAILFFLSFGLASVGFVGAWRTDSVQGFHAIMNLVLMPMWLLSGALFPPEGAPVWLRAVMYADPLTYGLVVLRHVIAAGTPGATAGGGPPLGAAVTVTVAFALAAFAAAAAVAGREERAEGQP